MKAFVRITIVACAGVLAWIGYAYFHERAIMADEARVLHYAIAVNDLWRNVKIIDPRTAEFSMSRSTYASGHMFQGIEQAVYIKSAEAMWVGTYRRFHDGQWPDDLTVHIVDGRGRLLATSP